MKLKFSKILNDILWYFIGFVIPAAVSFVKNPIFTRYFTPSEYGAISIVNSTLGILSMAIYSLITSCLFRYYNNYKNSSKLNVLYSNIMLLYICASVMTAATCIVWMSFYSPAEIRKLMILNATEIILSQIISIYTISMMLEGRAKRVNVINILVSISSFMLLVFLTFYLGERIEAVIISRLLIDILLFMYIFIISIKKIRISLRYISSSILKEFLGYGFPAALCNMGMMMLTYSDRLLIGCFDTMESVGIYNQVYNIGEMSISALVSIYCNAINPILLKELESNYAGFGKLMNRFTNIYILAILPFAVYFSLFSKQVSTILLGEKFRSGYTMMPYVIFAAFIYGMTELMLGVFRFGGNMKTLVKGFGAASAVNIVLNVAIIPVLGYKAAAATTFVSYLLLYLYYYKHISVKYFHSIDNLKTVAPAAMVLCLQATVDTAVRYWAGLDIDVLFTILEGTIFLFTYILAFRKVIFRLLKNDSVQVSKQAKVMVEVI